MRASLLAGVVLEGIQLYAEPHQPAHIVQFVGMLGLALLIWRLSAHDRRSLQATRRYQLLVEQSPVVMYIDVQGQGWQYLSPPIDQMLGYSIDEWLVRPTFWRDLLHPDDCDQVLALKKQRAAQGGRYYVEYRLKARDGRWVWVSDSAVVINHGSDSATFHGVLADISERKQIESRLAAEQDLLAQRVDARGARLHIENEGLARAAHMKDEFLSSMSHELRTPLNAILTLVESLEEGVYGRLDQGQLATLRTIGESGRYLLALINDILDLSKIEAGRIELQLDSVDLQAVCQASLRMVKQQALQKGLLLNLTFGSSIVTTQADERRLKQILVNLLSNAVKFTPEGGQVDLEVLATPASRQILFHVSDTGIGIPLEKQPFLFLPFTQIDSALSRRYDGTGLGLSLVRRLAELHGGHVTVVSEPDKGSRFTVALPWRATTDSAVPEAPPLPDPAPEPAAAPRLLALLVDDTLLDSSATRTHLQTLGIQVVPAERGAALIERALDLQPALIVLGLQMPLDSDLETVRRLRSTRGLATVPVIAIAVLVRQDDRERCLAAGVNEYLISPVGRQDLQHVVSGLLPCHEVMQEEQGGPQLSPASQGCSPTTLSICDGAFRAE